MFRKILVATAVVVAILILILVSAASPYIFATFQERVINLLKVNPVAVDIPIPNYIQSVSAVLSFLTATLISVLVYKLNSGKSKKEQKQAAYNLYAYFDFSTRSIENFNNDLSAYIHVDTLADCVYQSLFVIGMSRKDVDTLSRYHVEIQNIGRASKNNQDNLSNLCKRLCEGEDYLTLKIILAKIYSKHCK